MPSEAPIVNGSNEINGDHKQVDQVEAHVNEHERQDEEKVEQEIEPQLPTITVHLPKPTHGRTLPKPIDPETNFQTLRLVSQPSETIQEVKIAVAEWLGAYWLGPFSLRLPSSAAGTSSTSSSSSSSEPLFKTKDGIEIRPNERLSEWLEVGDVFAGVEGERELEVVREPYSEGTARQTVARLLELIAPAGSSIHTLSTSNGIAPGSTIFELVRDGRISSEPIYEEVEAVVPAGKKGKGGNGGKKETVKIRRQVTNSERAHAFVDWKDDWNSIDISKLATQPSLETLPCLRSIQLSPFNPPPPQFRQKGHQLYLQVSTLEGETLTLVCSTRGWYISKSNVNQFDPSARNPEVAPFHSVVDLLHSISPQFSDRLYQLPPLSTTPPALEPMSTVAIPQAEPSFPWLTPQPKPPVADIVRTQLAYLHSGATSADALDSARDWNEEIQGVRELPHSTMQERVLRERMAQKTWAEYTQASLRSVLAVARGDVLPINPNEPARSHMWLVSNIFITKAIDSIDAYAHLGGDAAAHVSHAKDAEGVKLLNKLDIDGVNLLGHTVIDWLGERWVCQSVLPGIFTRHESSEEKPEAEKEDATPKTESNPLIIYGVDSEHLTSLHWDEATHKVMEKIAISQRLAAHKVVGENGEEREYYASTEVKGLRGADGRRYLLDLPRLSPVDIEWLEKDYDGKLLGVGEEVEMKGETYPHRVTLLRPELIETFWENELKRWARDVAEQNKAKMAEAEAEKSTDAARPEDVVPSTTTEAEKVAENKIDPENITTMKQFELRFNPDAFVDLPLEKDVATTSSSSLPFLPPKYTDESDPAIKSVRDASVFLRTIAIPSVVIDALAGNTSGIMDGYSLSRHLHLRGINIRYLGHLLATIDKFSTVPEGQEGKESGHLISLKTIVIQEMILRACKHILRRLIKDLAPEHTANAVAHFLNCLLGSDAAPVATYEAIDLFVTPRPAYVELTPSSLREQIVEEVGLRYRWKLNNDFNIRKVQFLREFAMRFAFQLVQRDYFTTPSPAISTETPVIEKEKGGKKKANSKSTSTSARRYTFEPSDILTLLPVIRSTAPSVSVAEEIFEAGRTTINRGQIEMGLEFMLEGIQLYESIHSVIHPEVAAAYNQYGSTLHQLARIKIQQLAAMENADPEQPLGLDIATGLRLQRQAVIIAERTLGIWHPDTASYYFQLAMLENLEGNSQASLRYFRHLLSMWDVIYGPDHPEINTILSNVGVVLQALNDNALSLTLLDLVSKRTLSQFGPSHIQHGQALHQLTQAYFLNGDLQAALSTSTSAYEIFKTQYTEEHPMTKEVEKNVELLKTLIENLEKQKVANAQARESQLQRLRAAQARVSGSSAGAGATVGGVGAGKRRVLVNGPGSTAPAPSTAVAPVVPPSRIGEKGHLDVDELVNFIQGNSPAKASPRGKNALRGKRRTGGK